MCVVAHQAADVFANRWNARNAPAIVYGIGRPRGRPCAPSIGTNPGVVARPRHFASMSTRLMHPVCIADSIAQILAALTTHSLHDHLITGPGGYDRQLISSSGSDGLRDALMDFLLDYVMRC